MSTPSTIPDTRQTSEHDGLAIAAIISAFLFPVLAIILGSVSLHDAQRHNRRPSGLAIAGVLLGLLGTLGGIILIVILTSHNPAACDTSNANWPYC